MNKIYKLVKNSAGVSQVAGELGKGVKKGMLLAVTTGLGVMSFSAQAAAAIEANCTSGAYEFCFGSTNENDSGSYFVNESTVIPERVRYIVGFHSESRWNELKISGFALEVSNVVDKYIKLISAVDVAIKEANSVEIKSNKVIVNNSSADNMSGAVISFSSNPNVKYHYLDHNSIELNSSSVATNVYGAMTRGRPDSAGYETLTSNSVDINNSSATNVYGAAIIEGEYSGGFFNSKTILTDNTVSINGESSVTGKIYGGFIAFDITDIAKGSDIVTGNTFNFNNKNSITVAELGNFETYNIFLQESGWNYFENNDSKEKALITVTGKFGNQTTDENKDLAKANLVIQNQAFSKKEMQDVEKGSIFYILSMKDDVEYTTGVSLKDNLVINKEGNNDALELGLNTVNVGTIYFLDTELHMDDNSVYLSIPELTVPGMIIPPTDPDPDTGMIIPPILDIDKNALDRESPVLDSKVAALSILNSGNDLSHDISIGLEPTQKGEVIAFGKIAGEHNKAKGTSDIRINGVNALVGAGISLSDQTIVGGYFEYGYGHYDSTRDFDGYKNGTSEFSAMHYKGQGNVNYQGLGALLKAYANEDKNVYFNLGAKIGVINTNYSSTSFTDYNYRATNLDYAKSKLYFGAQVGTGFKTELTQNSQLNSSINFIYSQIGGNTFEMDESTIKLNKIKSERLVWNEEYKYYFNNEIGLKLSGAFDYEFRSIAEGTIDDHTMTNSSLRGGTVIFGAGVLITPFEDRNNQYFDLSVNASAGKNQSLGGSFTFNYKF